MKSVDQYTAAIDADALLEKYPWCTMLRAVADYRRGDISPLQALLATNRGAGTATLKDVDVERLIAVTQGEIIDRFLRLDDYRIVADEQGDVDDVRVEADFDEEDDLVSEELAEIYISQGLKNEAVEIYRKLSLLNPKKSAYFASQIEKLQKL